MAVDMQQATNTSGTLPQVHTDIVTAVAGTGKLSDQQTESVAVPATGSRPVIKQRDSVIDSPVTESTQQDVPPEAVETPKVENELPVKQPGVLNDTPASDIKPAATNGVDTPASNSKPAATNGVITNGTTREASPNLAVWKSVSKWLPSRGHDQDAWWKLTGPHMAVLLANADYSVKAQFETLLFWWRQIIPLLGPAAAAGTRGVSPTTMDGTRVEYSWRWSDNSKAPEIRVAFDPYSPATGSYRDPLGMMTGLDFLHDIAPGNEHVDMKWVYNFMEHMFESPHQIYIKSDGLDLSNHIGLGLEFDQDGCLPKMYLRPRKTTQEDKTGLLSLDDWVKVVSSAFGARPILHNTFDFLRTAQSKHGLAIQPIYVGADIVKNEDGRLKLYCRDTKTSFDSVTSVLTMGGAIKLPQAQLDDMWELIRGVCGLPDDFPRDQELPTSAAAVDPASPDYIRAIFWRFFGYYFEMGPNRDIPDVKLYLPTTHYGVNDQVVADTIVRWMEKNGRDKYIPAFWDSLHTIASHRRLDEGTGVMLWLALMIKKGSLQVTTYFAPEAYHPNRFAKQILALGLNWRDLNVVASALFPRLLHSACCGLLRT